MKSITLVLSCFSCFAQVLLAQSDTLMANSTHAMALFFPSPIKQAITGATHFTFSFNGEEPQRLGLLQGSPGPNSNLLVLTMDQKAYMYELRYESHLLKTYRHINPDENIESIKRYDTFKDSIPNPSSNPRAVDSIRLEKGCEFVLKRSESAIKIKRKNEISLRLMDLAYYGREVYLVIELENHSGIDFELEVLECYKIQGNTARKSSYQKQKLEVLYAHKLPDNIRAATSHRFVVVVPKFTLTDHEKLLIEVREKLGSRSVILKH